MMEILRASTFWHDVKNIIDYFGDVKAESVALRLVDALDETIAFIEEFPDLGSPWESTRPRHSGLRFRLVKGFENYVLMYRRDGERLYLLRVVHGSQNIEERLG